MHVIKVRNVNEAWPQGLQYLLKNGVAENSRNGPVLVAPGPVTTVYEKPTERVLFAAIRDANPYFHFMESLWMLAGRDTVADLTPYVKRMQDFSDNGITLNGAYGARWRTAFGFDQLPYVIGELKNNPSSRRAVLSMWDSRDLARGSSVDGIGRPRDPETISKDVPCNTQAYFWITNGALHMTVCNRSNDVIWGAYGANAVHFSYLMEYVARGVGVPVGTMYQVSNNYHVYSERPDTKKLLKFVGSWESRHSWPNRYAEHARDYSVPLWTTEQRVFERELQLFWGDPTWTHFAEPFFENVARPMRWSHEAYREGDMSGAYTHANRIEDYWWKVACIEWLQRREHAAAAKAEQQGPCGGGR